MQSWSSRAKAHFSRTAPTTTPETPKREVLGVSGVPSLPMRTKTEERLGGVAAGAGGQVTQQATPVAVAPPSGFHWPAVVERAVQHYAQLAMTRGCWQFTWHALDQLESDPRSWGGIRNRVAAIVKQAGYKPPAHELVPMEPYRPIDY